MNKKFMHPIIAIAIIIIVALTWLMFYGRNDAKMVLKPPLGFVSLQSYLKKGLTIMPFETQILFLDTDRISIYQTDFKNSDFIVKYKGDYYVNEEKIIEIADVAFIAPEQRRKVYSLSDTVEIRGAGATRYNVKINSIETGETESYGTDALVTYIIKYTVISNIPMNEEKMQITWVETEQGIKYNIFNFIDIDTVSVKIRTSGNDKIKSIVLRSPEYTGLSYKIDVY